MGYGNFWGDLAKGFESGVQMGERMRKAAREEEEHEWRKQEQARLREAQQAVDAAAYAVKPDYKDPGLTDEQLNALYPTKGKKTKARELPSEPPPASAMPPPPQASAGPPAPTAAALPPEASANAAVDPLAALPPQAIIPGNIDLSKRVPLDNADGTFSTVSSMSIGTDKGHVLIPTVVGGRRLTDDEAVARFNQTGQNLGTYKTPEEATAASQALSEQMGRAYGPPSAMPVQAAPQVQPKKPSSRNDYVRVNTPEGFRWVPRDAATEVTGAALAQAIGKAIMPFDRTQGLAALRTAQELESGDYVLRSQRWGQTMIEAMRQPPSAGLQMISKAISEMPNGRDAKFDISKDGKSITFSEILEGTQVPVGKPMVFKDDPNGLSAYEQVLQYAGALADPQQMQQYLQNKIKETQWGASHVLQVANQKLQERRFNYEVGRDARREAMAAQRNRGGGGRSPQATGNPKWGRPQLKQIGNELVEYRTAGDQSGRSQINAPNFGGWVDTRFYNKSTLQRWRNPPVGGLEPVIQDGVPGYRVKTRKDGEQFVRFDEPIPLR